MENKRTTARPKRSSTGNRRRTTTPNRRPSLRGKTGPSKIRTTRKSDSVPNADSKDVVRIIPLGGVEEVGKNMTAIEYGDSIMIVDMGFQFSDEDLPGVDYIIPETTYLEARKKKIKGVYITHGHLDHIGGIPYIMNKIGNPPVYTRKLTAALIKKRQDEFPYLPALDLQIIEEDKKIPIADGVAVKFFNVTHTIPDSMGVSIETPLGNIVFTGDVKVDHKDGKPLAFEEKVYGELSKEKNAVLLMDSTNVERPGYSLPESEVHRNIEKIIKEAKGRLIIGTFASLLERIIFIVQTADKIGKKVVIDGRSMKTNVDIAKELGLLKVNNKVFIPVEQMEDYPPEKIIIMATGAQGDAFASLMRMANKSHKKIKLTPTDTIVLSSSVIPGNEKAVQKLKDNLARQGPRILTFRELDIHSSGHGYQEELKWIQKKVKPKFFIPVHGYHHFLRIHKEVAIEAGIPEENIVIPDNGSIIELYDGGSKIRKLKDKAVKGVIMVDSLGTDDIKDVVVRDRQQLAQDGMFVVIATLNLRTGRVQKSPDIISRGFVYLKESQELLREARNVTKRTIEKMTTNMRPINLDFVKNDVRERISKLLVQKTGKRPIVLPVILEV